MPDRISADWAIAEYGTDRIPIAFGDRYFELVVTDDGVYLAGQRRLDDVQTRGQLRVLVDRLRHPEPDTIDSYALALGLWWLLD